MVPASSVGSAADSSSGADSSSIALWTARAAAWASAAAAARSAWRASATSASKVGLVDLVTDELRSVDVLGRDRLIGGGGCIR